MSAPVTQAEREAWLTRAEHDLAAMRQWATELERRFAAIVSDYGQLRTLRREFNAVRTEVAHTLEGEEANDI